MQSFFPPPLVGRDKTNFSFPDYMASLRPSSSWPLLHPQDWREEGKTGHGGGDRDNGLTGGTLLAVILWLGQMLNCLLDAYSGSPTISQLPRVRASLLVAQSPLHPGTLPSPHTYMQPSWVASSRTPGQLWPLAHIWTWETYSLDLSLVGVSDFSITGLSLFNFPAST